MGALVDRDDDGIGCSSQCCEQRQKSGLRLDELLWYAGIALSTGICDEADVGGVIVV